MLGSLHCSHHIFAPPSPEDVGRLVCAQRSSIIRQKQDGFDSNTDSTPMIACRACPSPFQMDVGGSLSLDQGIWGGEKHQGGPKKWEARRVRHENDPR
jgi:hypothetical protein